MDRRHFLEGLGAATAMRLLPAAALPGAAGAAATQAGEPVDAVAQFGFVPDGRTDNYAAFHRWAEHVNRRRGGHYSFRPGSYRVERYRTTPFRSRNPAEVINPHLFGCDGLTIVGHGARIVLNGRFHRTAEPGPDGLARGVHLAVFMPFTLRQCRNVTIAGFEMDGGVREMTRDDAVKETHAHLLNLQACSNVLLEDLDLHHCQTDGIYLGDDWLFSRMRPAQACRDVVLNRVTCRNNARGGLSPLQVRGLTATDCRFAGNGFDLGDYRYHPPGFGVDVEPNRFDAGVDIDARTGDLAFVRCSFEDNVSAFLAAWTRRLDGALRLADCTSRNANNRRYHMILNFPGAIVEGGRHDTGTGSIWTSWSGRGGGELVLRDLEIRSAGNYGLFHSHDGNLVTLERVRLIGTHGAPDFGGFPTIQGDPGGGRRNRVGGCEFFLPAARKSPERNWDIEPAFSHTLLEDNLFATDLPAAGGRHFATRYGPGTEARRDRYRGTAPGTADSFRPGADSRHDSRTPFSTGE